MTKDEQRIAIAEFCFPEYRDVPIEYWYTQDDDHTRDWVWKHPSGMHCIRSEIVPNYPEDLNAIHEAWLRLDFEQKIILAEHLAKIVERDYKKTEQYPPWNELRLSFQIALCNNATTPQRAEAFLRTIGKWKD